MAERDDRAELEALDETLFVAWADALPPVAPPASLRERVLGRVRETVPRNPLRTVRADEGWVQFAPGIDFKMLYRDEASGTNSLLARLQPGICMPEHEHSGIEECYVIEGEITYGDLTVRAGDYVFATDQVGVTDKALGYQLRVLDHVGYVAHDAGNQDFVRRQLHVLEQGPFVLVTRVRLLD